MTSAVITGRSMKMREMFMGLQLLGIDLAGRNGLDARAGKEAQLAVGDHRLSGRDALLEDDLAAHGAARRHQPRLHRLVLLDHVDELALAGPACTASAGTTVASRESRRSTALTNWPGHSSRSPLSKTAFSWMVPVVGSTALSITASEPRTFLPASSLRVTSTGSFAPALRARISPRCCSGTPKETKIGSIWLITTSVVSPLALTKLPACTRTLPARPVMGEWISQ